MSLAFSVELNVYVLFFVNWYISRTKFKLGGGRNNDPKYTPHAQ